MHTHKTCRALGTSLVTVVALAAPACEAEDAYVEATLAIREVEVRGIGALATVRGEGTLVISSEVDQSIALNRLSVGLATFGLDERFEPASVEVDGPWPVEARDGAPTERSFRFEGRAPAACPGAPFYLQTDVGLLCERRSCGGGAGTTEVPPARPQEVGAIPWLWTARVDVGTFATFPRLLDVGPEAPDAVWALTEAGELVLVGPTGVEIVAAHGATALAVSPRGDAIYTLSQGEGPTLRRLDASGAVVWQLDFDPLVGPLTLTVALAEGLVIGGFSSTSLTLGATTWPGGTWFIALLDATSGDAVTADTRPFGTELFDGHPRPAGGFVASVRDPTSDFDPTDDDLGWGFEVVAFDELLRPVAHAQQLVDVSASGSDGTLRALLGRDLTKLDAGLTPTWSVAVPCISDGWEGEDPRSIAALEDGSTLVATGATLLRVDEEGTWTSALGLQTNLRLHQRGGVVLGAWAEGTGTRIGRLDPTRLDEVLP